MLPSHLSNFKSLLHGVHTVHLLTTNSSDQILRQIFPHSTKTKLTSSRKPNKATYTLVIKHMACVHESHQFGSYPQTTRAAVCSCITSLTNTVYIVCKRHMKSEGGLVRYLQHILNCAMKRDTQGCNVHHLSNFKSMLHGILFCKAEISHIRH